MSLYAPGVALLAVAEHILRGARRSHHETPLDTRREGRAAASAKAGVGHFLDYVIRLHLGERLVNARVAAVGDVLVYVARRDVSGVSERDALLGGDSGYLAEVGRAVNRVVSQVAEDLIGGQLAGREV